MRNNLATHNKVIICHHSGALPLHRFWVENQSLAVYIQHIDLICLDFILNNDQCLCLSQDCGNITLCDLFRGITSISFKGHFSDSLLTHLNAMQLTKLVIGTGTVFYTPLPLLQSFSIACCLTTFEIHFLVAPISMEWSSLVRADLRACIDHLTIIILARDIDYVAADSEVLAHGRFLLWLLEDAGIVIQDIKECFIQALSRLSGFVDHFIANKAEKLTNMGIWLTGYQSEIKPCRLRGGSGLLLSSIQWLWPFFRYQFLPAQASHFPDIMQTRPSDYSVLHWEPPPADSIETYCFDIGLCQGNSPNTTNHWWSQC